MKKLRKNILIIFSLFIAVLLVACNSENTNTDKDIEKESNTKEAQGKQTRDYKDYMGHEVEIPTSPKRIVYHGENFGDLLPLDIKPVGTYTDSFKGSVFEDKVKNIEDLGFPIDLEKTLQLSPDLIIIANSDEKLYEQLSKIAPTVVFDTFAPLDKRIIELGNIVGKKDLATEWLNEYTAKEESMWKQLVNEGIIKQGETASVFTYYPGNKLFVMASTGLPQILYHSNGFKPVDRIQAILDKEMGFEEISLELLPEFAGDRIFILTPESDEAKQSTKDLLNNPIWNKLPAFKNNKVYTLEILKSSSDASTREALLEDLPSMLKK